MIGQTLFGWYNAWSPLMDASSAKFLPQTGLLVMVPTAVLLSIEAQEFVCWSCPTIGKKLQCPLCLLEVPHPLSLHWKSSLDISVLLCWRDSSITFHHLSMARFGAKESCAIAVASALTAQKVSDGEPGRHMICQQNGNRSKPWYSLWTLWTSQNISNIATLMKRLRSMLGCSPNISMAFNGWVSWYHIDPQSLNSQWNVWKSHLMCRSRHPQPTSSQGWTRFV